MKGTLICLIALCFGISAYAGSYPVYHYNVRGRALTALEDISTQYSGIYLRANLVLQDQQNGLYSAYLERPEYAQVHKNLSEGIDTNIPDEKLQYQPYVLDAANQKFEFAYINGVIKQLRVEPNTPTYVINLIKSILSQFQVDLQGQNLLKSHYNQKPEQNEGSEHFKTMEDTVTGKCETLYDVLPVEEHVLRQYPEAVPYPRLGQIFRVTKVKNYTQCNETVGYHFGLPQTPLKQIYGNNMNDFLAKSSVSNVYISGNFKDFLVQSAVTTNKIVVSPLKYNNQKGVVVSRMNVTLVEVRQTEQEVQHIKAPVVYRDLIYSFNNAADNESDDLQNLKQQYEHLRRQRQVKIAVEWENRGKDSSEESSKSNEDEDLYKQQNQYKPTPLINEAAENEFLAMYIGNQGQPIKTTVDVVPTVLDVISKIIHEMETSKDFARSEILSRYTILVKLIRLLNVEELAKVDSHYTEQPQFATHTLYEWKVFRDAVAQAGTGPALITIKRWIHAKRIYGEEAAQLISSLVNSAIYPTEEYIRIFYELSTNQEIQKQAILNDTAILSLTELVRVAYINTEEAYARYPVKSFNIIPSREIRHRFVNNELIPYLNKQLKQALQIEDGHKVQVYIRALANIADIHVLDVFKPYLEGEQPMSEFHRLLLVVSMDKLAQLQPKAIRYILHKLIMNPAESVQVRVAAVYQIMQTRPSADMLQGLAKLTHIEPSKEVRSAIRSSLESASKFEENWSEFARNARAALKMLKWEEYGIQYSENFLYEYIVKHMSLGYRRYMQKIHSEDSLLPNYIYYSFYLNQGGYSRQYMNFAAMVSNIRSLTGFFQDQWKHHEHQTQPKETSEWVEKVSRLLNITMNPQEKLQLNILTNLFGAKRFFVLDQALLNQIPEFVENVMRQIRAGTYFSFTKFYHEDEVTISFPTELSFPFVYTYKKPSMFHLEGDVSLQKANQWNLKQKFRFIAATKVEAKVGFVTPHDNQMYVAGYDKDIVINVPLEVHVGLDTATPNFSVLIAPRDRTHNETIVHYSTKPYTSHYNILSFQPARFEENSTLIHVAKRHQQVEKVFGQEHGIVFSASINSENLLDYHTLKHKMEKYGFFAPIMAILFEDNLYHTEIELKHIPELSQSRFINVGFEYMCKKRYQQEVGEIATQQPIAAELNTLKRSVSVNKKWQLYENIETTLLQRAPESGDIIRQASQNKAQESKKYLINLIQRVLNTADKYASGDAVAMTMEFVGRKPVKYVVGMACSVSKQSKSGRQVLHAYRVTDNEQGWYAVDIEADTVATQPSAWNFIEALRQESRLESNVQIHYGPKHAKPAQVNMNATWYKSDDRREALQNWPMTKVCKKQMEQKLYQHPACANLTVEAARIDRMYVQIDYEGIGNWAKNWSLKALNTLHHLGYDYLDENNVNATGTGAQQRIQMMAQFNPETYQTVDVVIKSPQRETRFNNVRVNKYIQPLVAFRPGVFPTQDLKAKLMNRIESKTACIFERNSMTTFNNRTYPATLGDCYHVYLHVDAQQPQENNYTVLVREAARDQSKQVKIIFGRKQWQKEIELDFQGQYPVVRINGQKQQIQPNTYQQYEFEQTRVRISSFDAPEIKIQFNDDLIVRYDRFRVQTQLSDTYYGVARGLCGANNGEPAYDFLAPRNCLMWDHQNFTASYALVDDTCQGVARQQHRDALKATCTPRTIKQYQIVTNWTDSDSEWKQQHECEMKLRTSYVYSGDKMCFTMEPVPVCTKGCKGKKLNEKIVDVHCLKPSKVTDLYRAQIDKGANPTFAGKKVSKTIKIKVPVTCGAQ